MITLISFDSPNKAIALSLSLSRLSHCTSEAFHLAHPPKFTLSASVDAFCILHFTVKSYLMQVESRVIFGKWSTLQFECK